MDACSRLERIQKNEGGFRSETTVDEGGNEVFRQFDERGRLFQEMTSAARAAETRVYDFGEG